ncbi:MAG: hypothetical protein M1825_003626 [Sarcosagium campestre]|nr:MAG: hypothetical protein M1825_003626 [Sarcosagium campestre]
MDDVTFISILDLSGSAVVLYVSDSVTDVLQYAPEEVQGRSCFEFFHPSEIPLARNVHGTSVETDKAAVLSYCRLKNKAGMWVGCEFVFTVVYNVLVASISIYRRGLKSQKRAVEAPIIQRLFSSPPADPRYHMLSLLSTKFVQGPTLCSHEPRAALFLNRFTRSAAIMYATSSVQEVLGDSPEELRKWSFYECVQQNCLPDAIRCLEGAKGNDSIAYMRFMWRHPNEDESADEMSSEPTSSDDSEEDGGILLDDHMDFTASHPHNGTRRRSSENSTDFGFNSTQAIFDQDANAVSSASTLPTPSSDRGQANGHRRTTRREPVRRASSERIEVEAVISCTSDGLVVIIRRARPVTSLVNVDPPEQQQPAYSNGLFASPWAAKPIIPPMDSRSTGNDTTDPWNMFSARQPSVDNVMNSIREVAVFAWSLTGINGNLAKHGRGKPSEGAQPQDGFPIWAPRPVQPTSRSFISSDRVHESAPPAQGVNGNGILGYNPMAPDGGGYGVASHYNNIQQDRFQGNGTRDAFGQRDVIHDQGGYATAGFHTQGPQHHPFTGDGGEYRRFDYQWD